MRTSLPKVDLPRPQSEEWDWQLDAACRAMSPAVFFAPRGLRGYALARLEREAKLVCAQCPVIEQCRTHAIECHEPYGIWGGLTTPERVSLARASSAPAPRPPRKIGPPQRAYVSPLREKQTH